MEELIIVMPEPETLSLTWGNGCGGDCNNVLWGNDCGYGCANTVWGNKCGMNCTD